MIIQTNRIILRQASLEDIDSIVSYLLKNKEAHKPYEALREDDYYTQAFWQNKIKFNQHKSFDEQGARLFIFDKAKPDTVIGYCNFDNVVRGAFQACTLGYAIDKDYEGKGLMYEGLTAAIDYVFKTHNLHRIQANYIKHNIRSAKLLERCGFNIEGEAKDYLFINGQWQDHILTSLINPSWHDIGKGRLG